MSHVDDGTLHAYLDGALPGAEGQAVDAHLAACPPCRRRLDEERALIRRADELLGLAAPPERAVPPFSPGDREPPVRLWWQLRLPLAWAATVALALGVGVRLGRGWGTRSERPIASRGEPAEQPRSALDAVDSADARLSEPLAIESRPPRSGDAPSAAPGAGGVQRAQAPVSAAPVLLARPGEPAPAARERDQVAAPAVVGVSAAAAPVAVKPAGETLTGPSLTLEDARALLGTFPRVVPGVPVRGIHGGHLIGYADVVVVEQALDASTTIAVITARPAAVALQPVIVAGEARSDSTSSAERAYPRRATPASNPAPPAARKAAAAPRPGRGVVADHLVGGLFLDVRGPLSGDSLAALRRRLEPLRP